MFRREAWALTSLSRGLDAGHCNSRKREEGQKSACQVTQAFHIGSSLNQAQLFHVISNDHLRSVSAEQYLAWALGSSETHLVITWKCMHLILVRQEKYLLIHS